MPDAELYVVRFVAAFHGLPGELRGGGRRGGGGGGEGKRMGSTVEVGVRGWAVQWRWRATGWGVLWRCNKVEVE